MGDTNGSESNGTSDKNGTSNGSTNTTTANGSASQPRKKSRLDLQNLPSRQYLDQTVVPILLDAITELTKERPSDPVQYLAKYLMDNKDKYSNPASAGSTS